MDTRSRTTPLTLSLATFALLGACGVEIRDNTPNGPIDAECSESDDDCFGDDICIRGYCEPAYARTYELSIDEVVLPSTDPNGQCWDVPCGPPDPYIVVRVDGREVGVTDEASDRFEASFGDIFTFDVDYGSSLEINLYDADIDTDDLALDCSARPIDTRLLRSRFITCGSRGQSNYLRATILPVD